MGNRCCTKPCIDEGIRKEDLVPERMTSLLLSTVAKVASSAELADVVKRCKAVGGGVPRKHLREAESELESRQAAEEALLEASEMAGSAPLAAALDRFGDIRIPLCDVEREIKRRKLAEAGIEAAVRDPDSDLRAALKCTDGVRVDLRAAERELASRLAESSSKSSSILSETSQALQALGKAEATVGSLALQSALEEHKDAQLQSCTLARLTAVLQSRLRVEAALSNAMAERDAVATLKLEALVSMHGNSMVDLELAKEDLQRRKARPLEVEVEGRVRSD